MKTSDRSRNPRQASKPNVGKWFAKHPQSARGFRNTLAFLKARYRGTNHGYIDRKNNPEYRFESNAHGVIFLFARLKWTLVRVWVDPEKLLTRYRARCKTLKNFEGSNIYAMDFRIESEANLSTLGEFLDANSIPLFSSRKPFSKKTVDSKAAIEDGVSTDFKKLSGGSKRAVIKQRINAGVFRNRVLKIFHNRCGVSGVENLKLLICSHIKPWAKSKRYEQNDTNNALLLAANWDALFDKYLISFDDRGKPLVSPRLTKDDLSLLGIEPKTARLEQEFLSKPRLAYLALHRKKLLV